MFVERFAGGSVPTHSLVSSILLQPPAALCTGPSLHQVGALKVSRPERVWPFPEHFLCNVFMLFLRNPCMQRGGGVVSREGQIGVDVS